MHRGLGLTDRSWVFIFSVFCWTGCPGSGQGGGATDTARLDLPEDSTADTPSTDDGDSPIDRGQDLEVDEPDAPDLPAGLVRPEDVVYRGAFRLPFVGEAPNDFAYGGEAMTFNPNGDPTGAADGYPGSLFIAGAAVDADEWDCVGDDCELVSVVRGSLVAEVQIPAPDLSRNTAELDVAGILQGFHDIRGDRYPTVGELSYFQIPKLGIEFLPPQGGQSSARLYMTWGQHLVSEGEEGWVAPLSWCDLDLSDPQTQGAWWVGDQHLFNVTDYLFEIPAAWADVHVGGRRLAVGRYRDGGQGGQGPAVIAVGPWLGQTGDDAPANGTHLDAIPLVQYPSVSDDDPTLRMTDYQHADEWIGGAWLTTDTTSALAIIGAKAVGEHTWYGWQSPAGDGVPCVESVEAYDAPGCQNADMTPCDRADTEICCEVGMEPCCAASEMDICNTTPQETARGWWSSRWDAQMVFYDPNDLAQVASGDIEPHVPQPYATRSIHEHMLLAAPETEDAMLGTGQQRRYVLGAVAYDRGNNILYVTELFGDAYQPIVHVFQINPH